jgi:hypothetical protein
MKLARQQKDRAIRGVAPRCLWGSHKTGSRLPQPQARSSRQRPTRPPKGTQRKALAARPLPLNSSPK